MKQSINIEYTEEEFKTVYGFLEHFITSGAGIISKIIEVEGAAKIARIQSDKLSKVKDKIKITEKNLSEQISEIKERLDEVDEEITELEINKLKRKVDKLEKIIKNSESTDDDELETFTRQ
jgi:chromosome segregation ATPase